MQRKFLKDMISIIAGIPGENIVDILDEKKYVNEFLIAKKLDITVNQVRNVLYKEKRQKKRMVYFFLEVRKSKNIRIVGIFFLEKNSRLSKSD